MNFIGNEKLFDEHKIAFLCSRKCPADIVLKSYDWAIDQRDKGNCVISGFHSKIEKDVFHFLLKGNQPVILALARGLKERYEPEILEEIKKQRLLIVTPFKNKVKRITRETARKRNEFIAELADEIFVAFANEGGSVARLVEGWKEKNKIITSFYKKGAANGAQ